MSSAPKVFAIGFNKTGTTSLTAILKRYGLSTNHHGGWHFWTWKNEYHNFNKYDAYTDGQQKDFRELEKKFPGSKYILNTRSLQSWLSSRWCHVETNKRTKRSKWTDNSKKALISWAYSRDNYHADVLEYFKDRPNDFMVLDLQTMSSTEIFGGLNRILKGIAKKTLPIDSTIPKSNPTNNNLKSSSKKCVEEALNEIKMSEEDKKSNTVSQFFRDEKYSIEVEKAFYDAHKVKLFYQPYKKELRT